jgi:hypothetical protein
MYSSHLVSRILFTGSAVLTLLSRYICTSDMWWPIASHLTICIDVSFYSLSTLFHWMESIALVHSSLELKMIKPSKATKKLLIAVGAVIVGMDVTASVFDVYGISGASILAIGLVYSVWSLLMAGVSLYTSCKLRGIIYKIHTVTERPEVTEPAAGESKAAVIPTATGNAVAGGTMDIKEGPSNRSAVEVTSLTSEGKQAMNKEKVTSKKIKYRGTVLRGIGDKLESVLRYVNISAALLIVVVVASLLMALDARYTSPVALAIVTYLPVWTENGLSLSDMRIISKSIDS